MNTEHRYRLYIVIGVLALALLVWLTLISPPAPEDIWPGLLFYALVVFTTTFGVPLGEGMVSLLPMTTVTACLVMGPIAAGWVAFTGALTHVAIRTIWSEQLGLRIEKGLLASTALVAANATMQSTSILGGGAAFLRAGGTVPLIQLDLATVPQIALLALTYLAVNYSIAGAFIRMRGPAALRQYLRALPSLLLYEGIPLFFAPLTTMVYTHLGLGSLALFALILVGFSLITRRLSRTLDRLERRVKELDSLQAVGQALSASLDIAAVLSAIHTQVSQLMPAEHFYVALHDPETDEVSFPLAIQDGQPVHWRSRRTGSGLTEHLLRTRTSLLIRRDVSTRLKELGIDLIGQPAASWLGVPILAGGNTLGVIAVQSYSTPEVYDTSHERILLTIAAQAAIAIQNARLYALTDEALARRVQELDSILRTTREGILLLDSDWYMLAANRALADYLGVAQAELTKQRLDTHRPGDDQALITLIGYTPEELQEECAALAQEQPPRKKNIVVRGPPQRHVERTLARVRGHEGNTTGWLFVFRDLTEEYELARLRDELTHMLIHDLRSPLTAVKSGLQLIERALSRGKQKDLDTLLQLTQEGSDRMLHLINELLVISQLESGQMPLDAHAVEVKPLLEEVVGRLAPLATPAQIALEISAGPDLPPLYVDRGLISRVINNLVDNAIKFTPDGGRVQVWARRDVDSPDTLLVGVSDSGPGIPLQDHSRLFLKFEVISHGGRRRGTGLGLSFCKLAVEAHRGNIWVESEEGEGSTFIVRLPMAKSV